MVILKMKIIKSNYDFKTDMYDKYFPILEKVAESTGTTLILVRNHFRFFIIALTPKHLKVKLKQVIGNTLIRVCF